MTEILITTLWLLLVSPTISVRAAPSVCLAPCYVRVWVSIPSHENNRRAVILIDGGVLQSSTIQLDGENAPRIFTLNYPNLPAGEYTISAVLYNSTTEVSRHQTTVIIK